MTLDFKRKAGIGIGVGLGFEILGRVLYSGVQASGVDVLVIYVVIACLIGQLFFIWGCTNYALSKGLPHWFGYFGLFNLIGLVIIFLVPGRQSSRT